MARKENPSPTSPTPLLSSPSPHLPPSSPSPRPAPGSLHRCPALKPASAPAMSSNNLHNAPRILSQIHLMLQNFNHEDFEHSKTYSRRRVEVVKNKGKAVVASVPSSCPPVGRTKSLGDRRKNLDTSDLLKTSLVPRWKSKKKRRHSMPKERVHPLPQDFIDKQRAYFAEIDAFELPKEEVSESELE